MRRRLHNRALPSAGERQELLLACLQIAHAALGGRKIAPRLLRIGHRERRARTMRLVHRTAPIQVRLREHFGLHGPLARLCVDQDDVQPLVGRLHARVRQFEVHREYHGMQHERGAERHGEHPIVAGRDPRQTHVPCYFSWTSLS